VGETLLGGNFSSWLDFAPSSRSRVRAGVFFDHRSGGDQFGTEVKPVLAYRYQTAHSLGVFGTLETVRRHGYLEPLEVRQLDITRPVEYGAQWVERRLHFDGELYINWQVIDSPSSREVFDYGWLLTAKPVAWAHLDWQAHGLHRGGQLYATTEPVRNNFANALGLRLQAPVPVVRGAYLWAYRFWSSGNANPAIPDSLAANGTGTYLKGGIRPAGFDVYAISWWGDRYLSNEGDNNYNSVGRDPSYYKADRWYFELGVLRHVVSKPGIGADFEFRLHQIDHFQSIAIGTSYWEYSYRVMIYVPFQLRLWSGKPEP
jgi:hypothetical protein